jgi:hypothetical protein
VKGKSPQGPRVTVQMEQYLLHSAAQLTISFCPAATASRLTSSMLPRASLGASQLLKPASTTPRSDGRRHRSWHYEPQAQTNCRNLRRQHREAMYMQRTPSGAAGNGLYTTTKYMRGASGISMGTTIKHLRRTTSGAAGKCLGATS